MSQLILRADIAAVLRRWQDGSLTTEEVYDWATELYWPGLLDFADWEGPDDNSVANEVLQLLDTLGMELLTVEDVPLLLEFLETPIGQFDAGYAKFQQAYANIDADQRRLVLRDIEFYAPYCQPPRVPGTSEVN